MTDTVDTSELPRVTPQDIQDAIDTVQFFTAGEGAYAAGHLPTEAMHRLTICVITLKNGYTVTGTSACAHAELYNKEIGQNIARKKAEEQIWPLLGFRLRDTLQRFEETPAPTGHIQFLPGVQTYVGTKVIYAGPMTRLAYCELRGWEVPENENGDDDGFLVQYVDGGVPNLDGFTGYVSWSPKDVFEKAYSRPTGNTPPKTEGWMERLKAEFYQLEDRREKLGKFFSTDTFNLLPKDDQYLLRQQYECMNGYSNILKMRIGSAGG